MQKPHAQTNDKANWALQGPKNPQIMKFSAKNCMTVHGSLKQNDLCASPKFMAQRQESSFNVHSAPKGKEVAANRPLCPKRKTSPPATISRDGLERARSALAVFGR